MSTPSPSPVALASWSECARPLLVLMLTFARHLEPALRTEDLARAVAVADLFVKETSDDQYRDLVDSCPDVEAGAEIGAALAVFRNAAFVLRHLGAADRARSQLRASCALLLEQGTMHLDRAIALAVTDPD